MSFAYFSSSVQSVVQRVTAAVDPKDVSEEQQVIKKMSVQQSSLANRLVQTLTLLPLARQKAHAFIVQDLPRMGVTAAAADAIVANYKLENGQALLAQSYTSFPDVDPRDWYAPAVAYVQFKGLIQGQANGLFAPTGGLNQAELAVILARAMDKRMVMNSSATAGTAFSGWPTWGQDAIAKLRMRGVNVSFFNANPTAPVTRLLAARAITDTLLKGASTNMQTIRYFSDTVRLAPDLQTYINVVSSTEVMTGKASGLFEPYGLLNRAEAAKIFAKAIDVKVPVLKGAAK